MSHHTNHSHTLNTSFKFTWNPFASQKPKPVQTMKPIPKKAPKHPISAEDKKRQKIAKDNHQIVLKNHNLINANVDTIDEYSHTTIDHYLKPPKPKGTKISVTSYSSIDTAIYYHNKGFTKICVLNFADAKKKGGGYLNGRNAQEECLCRQTLLYPTLDYSSMYSLYKSQKDLYTADFMTYSPNVKVIRDNNNQLLSSWFDINIISTPAVDNRDNIKNANKIMERRIRKIIKLAAFKGNQVLILGAFGCGVFNNDTQEVAKIFKKVSIKENLKDYFSAVSFPIYKGNHSKTIFENALCNSKS